MLRILVTVILISVAVFGRPGGHSSSESVESSEEKDSSEEYLHGGEIYQKKWNEICREMRSQRSMLFFSES